MEKIKCFICLEENSEANMIKICKCNESYICLIPCYQAYILEKNLYFLESQMVKCPICKSSSVRRHYLYCDWRRVIYLLEIYFLALYYPFITIIWPLLYIFVIKSDEKENNEFWGKTDNVVVGFFVQLGVIIFTGLFYIYAKSFVKIKFMKRRINYYRIFSLFYTICSIFIGIMDNYVVFLEDRFFRNFLVINSSGLLLILSVCLYNLYLFLGFITLSFVREMPIMMRKIGILCGCLIFRPIHPENEKIDF